MGRINAIRRNIFEEVAYDKMAVKAIALAVFVKKHYTSSCVLNFSYNKLRKMTGLHDCSLKKRISKLSEFGLIKRTGRNEEHLVIGSIASSNSKRNIDISCIKTDTIKDIENSILAMAIVEIQKHKDYAKHILDRAANSRKPKELKGAKRKCRKYGYERKYREYGLSYKGIAKRLGVCLQKAIEIVKYAVKNCFLEVEKRQKQIFFPGASYMSKFFDGKRYTFCTLNNVYRIYANVYSIGPRVIFGGTY